MISTQRLRLFGLCAILLAVFALYAPAIRLMPFNDDAPIVADLAGITPLTIFENRFAPYSLVFGHYRPVGYLPWVLIGDLFGWYLPSMLHMLNVFAHVAATALVAALAARLCALFRLPRAGPSLAAGAIFGLLPLSYSAVLWAAAVVHVQVVLFGLAAVWAYLALACSSRHRRLGLIAAVGLLMLTLLSHEQGPAFGAFLLWAELSRAFATRSRPRPAAFVLFAMAAAYFVFYRLFLQTDWTSGHSLLLESRFAEMPVKLAYHAQHLVVWLVALARPFVNLSESQSVVLILGMAGAVVATAALAFARRRRLAPLACVLGFWAIGTLPSLLLSQRYLLDGPRLLYPQSFGMALFWALSLALMWQTWPRRAPRVGLALACIAALIWSASYVAARMNEAARLTPALRLVDADLRRSEPTDRLLFINAPFVNIANQPALLLGREGLPIWMYFYATEQMAPQWPAAISGITRPTFTVMHEASLSDRQTNFREPEFLFTRGDQFHYGVFGREVDDEGLREWMLRATFIYRFDYDAPGFRLTRLGEIRNKPATSPASPLATFQHAGAQVRLDSARALRCGNQVELRLAWSGAAGFTEPAAVFIHVVDANGTQIVGADRDPLDGFLPLDRFPPGIAVSELRHIRNLPDESAPAFVLAGVYARADLARYQALRDTGALWEGEQVVIPISAGSDDCAP